METLDAPGLGNELLLTMEPTIPLVYVPAAVHRFSEIALRPSSLPAHAEMRAVVQAHYATRKLFELIGAKPGGAFIDRADAKTLLFYHVTPKPDELIRALRAGKAMDPPRQQMWGSRCFGPGAAFYTNRHLAEHSAVAGNERRSIVTIAVHHPRSHLEVALKQGYWKYLTQFARRQIENDPKLNVQLQNALDELLSDQMTLVDEVLTQTCAFYFRGLIIDLYCALVPTQSRTNFAATMQSVPDYEHFGFRTYTDAKHFSIESMNHAVHFMLANANLSDQIRDGTEQMMRKLIAQIFDHFSEYLPTNDVSMIDGKPKLNRPVEYVLMNLLQGHENPLRDYLAASGHFAQLLEQCNGWYPMNETRSLFGDPHGLGWDHGSNAVGIIRHFNERTDANPNGVHEIVSVK